MPGIHFLTSVALWREFCGPKEHQNTHWVESLITRPLNNPSILGDTYQVWSWEILFVFLCETNVDVDHTVRKKYCKRFPRPYVERTGVLRWPAVSRRSGTKSFLACIECVMKTLKQKKTVNAMRISCIHDDLNTRYSPSYLFAVSPDIVCLIRSISFHNCAPSFFFSVTYRGPISAVREAFWAH